jgi:hypothetical protein
LGKSCLSNLSARHDALKGAAAISIPAKRERKDTSMSNESSFMESGRSPCEGMVRLALNRSDLRVKALLSLLAGRGGQHIKLDDSVLELQPWALRRESDPLTAALAATVLLKRYTTEEAPRSIQTSRMESKIGTMLRQMETLLLHSPRVPEQVKERVLDMLQNALVLPEVRDCHLENGLLGRAVIEALCCLWQSEGLLESAREFMSTLCETAGYTFSSKDREILFEGVEKGKHVRWNALAVLNLIPASDWENVQLSQRQRLALAHCLAENNVPLHGRDDIQIQALALIAKIGIGGRNFESKLLEITPHRPEEAWPAMSAIQPASCQAVLMWLNH